MRLRRGKHLKGAAQQTRIGNDLDEDVDQRPDAAEHQNDPDPVGFRPAPHEVQDGDGLQDDAVRVDEAEHAAARL